MALLVPAWTEQLYNSLKILIPFEFSNEAQSGNFLAPVIIVGQMTLFIPFQSCILESCRLFLSWIYDILMFMKILFNYNPLF